MCIRDREFREDYPLFRYHLTSGNTEQVVERLDRGLIDFAVIVEPPNLSKYNYIEVPETNAWGLVMKKDDPLASKKSIEAVSYTHLLRPLDCQKAKPRKSVKDAKREVYP